MLLHIDLARPRSRRGGEREKWRSICFFNAEIHHARRPLCVHHLHASSLTRDRVSVTVPRLRLYLSDQRSSASRPLRHSDSSRGHTLTGDKTHDQSRAVSAIVPT